VYCYPSQQEVRHSFRVSLLSGSSDRPPRRITYKLCTRLSSSFFSWESLTAVPVHWSQLSAIVTGLCPSILSAICWKLEMDVKDWSLHSFYWLAELDDQATIVTKREVLACLPSLVSVYKKKRTFTSFFVSNVVSRLLVYKASSPSPQ